MLKIIANIQTIKSIKNPKTTAVMITLLKLITVIKKKKSMFPLAFAITGMKQSVFKATSIAIAKIHFKPKVRHNSHNNNITRHANTQCM